uniref:Glycosyltransferase n=1 Tax=viral metagenome TaxID=1070528 RepID=A0A6C0D773_9ZZZZ
MSLAFISHCHTDYSETWSVYFDYLFKNNSTFKKVVCVNNKNAMEEFFKTKGYIYDRLIEYDETIPFAQRMVYILNQLDYEYVLFSPDNIILLSYDNNKITTIVNWLYNNNYDSVQFHMKKNDNSLINISNDITVYQIHDLEYPFSFLPSIWNRITLLNAYKSVPNSSYRFFEIDVMNFINNNANVFRLKDIGQEKIVGWDSDMEPWFIYLHIIHQRKWCGESFFRNDYFKNEHNTIMQKYNINTTKLGVLES